MNKLILTLAVGEAHQALGRVTHPLMQAYAEKCGADFKVLTERTGDWSIPWEKCAIFDLLGAEYDRLIFLDADCIVRPDCPDLFELVPEEKFGAFNEGYFLPREEALREGMRQYGCPELAWNGQYFNTGVCVLSRKHRHIFRHPAEHIDNFWEQTYVNIAAIVFRLECVDIRYEMNYLPSLQGITGLTMESAYIAHLAGQHPGTATELAKQIIGNWEKAAPEYKFPRRVWLDIAGGLGDVIDAEPVLRYTRKHIFPDDDVRVTTPWPRVFMGHTDIPLRYGDRNPFEPDLALKLETKPPEGSGIWSTLTHTTSNATDFASISMLHQQLPIADRRIKLSVMASDVQEIEKLAGDFLLERAVLVHAGRSWASRTFPLQWWQAVVDGIAAEAPVVLCGLQGEIHGHLPVVCPENGLDLRDRTSMGGMFELVRRCRVLVSNDSSPVHVAGAWDNWIILIPSARHPDLVLPWRHGHPYWKAWALYKRLTIDDVAQAPCQFYGSFADGQPPRPWDEYLPDAAEVVAKTLEVLHGNQELRVGRESAGRRDSDFGGNAAGRGGCRDDEPGGVRAGAGIRSETGLPEAG